MSHTRNKRRALIGRRARRLGYVATPDTRVGNGALSPAELDAVDLVDTSEAETVRPREGQ